MSEPHPIYETMESRQVQALIGFPLRPCPFCDSERLQIMLMASRLAVVCLLCGATGPQRMAAERGLAEQGVERLAAIVARWNQRFD